MMILCVSVDGVDGAGKTTLIEALSKKYNIVTLPRFYCMGMVPQDRDDRKNWFITQDTLATTKIYISGYKLRLLGAREFKSGLHYKFLNKAENNLVVIDRGFLSLKAYSFAMLKKTEIFSSEEADKKILEFTTGEFDNVADETIDLSILLFKDSLECLNEILNRRIYDENENMLIRYQHEYYSRHFVEIKNSSKIKIISPLNLPEKVFEMVLNKIEDLKNVQRL